MVIGVCMDVEWIGNNIEQAGGYPVGFFPAEV
jgi:hypothetical protein